MARKSKFDREIDALLCYPSNSYRRGEYLICKAEHSCQYRKRIDDINECIFPKEFYTKSFNSIFEDYI